MKIADVYVCMLVLCKAACGNTTYLCTSTWHCFRQGCYWTV